MPRTSAEIISKTELEFARRCLIIHDLDDTITKSDINSAIAKALRTNLIKFKVDFKDAQFIHGRQSQCAMVTFYHEEYVTRIMNCRPIVVNGKKPIVSRQLPRTYYLSHQITHGLKVKIMTNKDVSKNYSSIDFQRCFRNYGSIQRCERPNESTAYLLFNDYDVVDRIVLENRFHKYQGVVLRVDKVRVPQDNLKVMTSADPEFCIHVTNLPDDVTGDELSSNFEVNIANILIRPYNESNKYIVEKDRILAQAWIKEIGNEQFTQRIATNKTGMNLRGFKIQCQAIRVPLDVPGLCEYFQKGTCRYSIGCFMKHIQCVQPINCDNTKCWYGHSVERVTRSEPRPIQNEDGYRIRIVNFPPNVTRAEIFNRLDVTYARVRENLILPTGISPNEPIIAYVVNQRSESIAKQLIRSWHDQPFSSEQPYKMKCQLEVNVDYFNSAVGIQLSLTPQSGSRTPSIVSSRNSTQNRRNNVVRQYQQRLAQSISRISLDQNENNSQYTNGQLTTIQLPFPWCWTNSELLEDRMNNASRVYLITDQTNSNNKAEIRVYSTTSNRTARLRVQRHQIVLKQLKEVTEIPKLISCNYDLLTDSSELSGDLWIITEAIEGIRLDTYISDNRLTLREKLHIILSLINFIKQIHKKNIVHRNLTPTKIFINPSIGFNNDEICLKLIDFESAHIDQTNHIQKNNQRIVSQFNTSFENNFYMAPQFELEPLNENDIDAEYQSTKIERQSKKIDTSFICAILFWMITLNEPKESRNIDGKAPHELNESIQSIEDELKTVVTEEYPRKLEFLRRHFKLIFDRGFAKTEDQQWPIDQLEYQIRLIIKLITNMKNQDEIFDYSPDMSWKYTVSNNAFIRSVSFIDRIKHQFVSCYSRVIDTIHWSENEQNRWSGNNKIMENYDELIIEQFKLPIKFEIIRRENTKNLQLVVKIKMQDGTIVELPCGNWIENEIENEFKTITDIVIMEFMNFYNIFLE